MTGGAQQPRAQAAAAARFAAGQAAQLAGALRARGDRREVARRLAEHDAAHGRWVETLSAAAGNSPAAAQRLLVLYVFCGRVAGALEGPPRRGLRAVCADTIDGVLLRCLDELAAEVVALLGSPGPSPAGPEPG
jgi:hypothetical protein